MYIHQAVFSSSSALTSQDRYALLDRVGRLARRRSVVWWGFDVRNDVRLLLSGEGVSDLVRALKSGTVQSFRRSNRRHRLGPTEWSLISDLGIALVELHNGEDDPLSTPWTSHRDVLGFRSSAYFDASHTCAALDPRWLHIHAGGGDLPVGWPPSGDYDLHAVMRASALVLGTLPADRRTFGLFAHLSRWAGARQLDVAHALQLTPRRVRQLQAKPEPRLLVATQVLADPRFRAQPRRSML